VDTAIGAICLAANSGSSDHAFR
jgi:hypothetical protein